MQNKPKVPLAVKGLRDSVAESVRRGYLSKDGFGNISVTDAGKKLIDLLASAPSSDRQKS